MSFVKLASAAALAVFMSASAQGSLLVSDAFPYADGDLVGNTPAVGGTWAAHSGTTGPVQVTSGQAVLAQGVGAQDVNSSFDGGWTAGTNGNTVFSSFDLTVPDPGAAVSNTYFAHFMAGTSSFVSRVWITDSTPTLSGYRIALSNDSSITDGDGEVFSSNLAYGTTYTIVTSYDFVAKAGSLWINPTLASHPSLDATDPGFADAVTAYAFRQSSGNTGQNIDNLKVGTSFYDVTGIPEPSSLCLLGLGGLALIGRKRRNAAIA